MATGTQRSPLPLWLSWLPDPDGQRQPWVLNVILHFVTSWANLTRKLFISSLLTLKEFFLHFTNVVFLLGFFYAPANGVGRVGGAVKQTYRSALSVYIFFISMIWDLDRQQPELNIKFTSSCFKLDLLQETARIRPLYHYNKCTYTQRSHLLKGIKVSMCKRVFHSRVDFFITFFTISFLFFYFWQISALFSLVCLYFNLATVGIVFE